jgi:hypothetical protein
MALRSKYMPKDIEALVLNPDYATGKTWKVVRGNAGVGGIGDMYVVADELRVTEGGCLVFMVNGIPQVVVPANYVYAEIYVEKI